MQSAQHPAERLKVLRQCTEKSNPVRDLRIFLFYPGFEFKVLDRLITNFHLPESTLIMLVSAFAGYDFIINAYKEAVKEKYRFFFLGDAMSYHRRILRIYV